MTVACHNMTPGAGSIHSTTKYLLILQSDLKWPPGRHFDCSKPYFPFINDVGGRFVTMPGTCYPNVQFLQQQMQFNWIMSAEDIHICSETAQFIHCCLSKCKSHITESTCEKCTVHNAYTHINCMNYLVIFSHVHSNALV
jgi:hypothetical protein